MTRFAAIDDAALVRLVDEFYSRARRDPLLGPVFIDALGDPDGAGRQHWVQHLDRVRGFWASVMMGTGEYLGRPMQAHAALPTVEDPHFRRWLQLFGDTAMELFEPGPANALVARADRMALALKQGIAIARRQRSPGAFPTGIQG